MLILFNFHKKYYKKNPNCNIEMNFARRLLKNFFIGFIMYKEYSLFEYKRDRFQTPQGWLSGVDSVKK